MAEFAFIVTGRTDDDLSEDDDRDEDEVVDDVFDQIEAGLDSVTELDSYQVKKVGITQVEHLIS